jgi:hypothetical protein
MIENDKFSLEIKDKSNGMITFERVDKDSKTSQTYDFGFMRYSSNSQSGAYVFKSQGSIENYPHEIKSIKALVGKNMQQFYITYQETNNDVQTLVKLKVFNG